MIEQPGLNRPSAGAGQVGNARLRLVEAVAAGVSKASALADLAARQGIARQLRPARTLHSRSVRQQAARR